MNSFNPNDPLIQQNRAKVKKVLDDPNMIVYFVPSATLKQVVAQGEHPLVQGITSWMKFQILQGKGIRIQKRIVWEMICGTLDHKNTFIFSNGDMRISWQGQAMGDTGVGWDDNSLWDDIIKKGKK